VQLRAPADEEKEPAGHGVQLAAPAPAKDPAGQSAQPIAPSVPGAVTTPQKPGAQMVQAATDAHPAAEPVVKTPGGQATQPEALVVPGMATTP
jgi:hypothetical protein